MKLLLSDDRTEIDLDRVAEAFAIDRKALENGIRLGATATWFERGAGGRPRMIFHCADTGARVALDQVGNIISTAEKEA